MLLANFSLLGPGRIVYEILNNRKAIIANKLGVESAFTIFWQAARSMSSSITKKLQGSEGGFAARIARVETMSPV